MQPAKLPHSHQSPGNVCPANEGKDKHNVSTTTKSSLFMFSPLPKYAGFYQELLSGTVNYMQLANRLHWSESKLAASSGAALFALCANSFRQHSSLSLRQRLARRP